MKDVNLEVVKGDFVCICGASGSGKTTLLNLIAGIDCLTEGRIVVLGDDLTDKDEDFLSDFRCQKVGFVFQSYNLVSTLTVAENIAFPMEWRRTSTDKIGERIAELLETLGMQHRAGHFPCQLSGGEQQRVAFARALANDPPLLLVDEPTGNLDQRNSRRITEILDELKAEGKTVIASTHDLQLLKLADKTFYLNEGRLISSHE